MTSTSGGEGLIIPDHVQILGETGHFYTVVTVEAENQEAADDEEEEEEEDILVCGKCKAQFSDVQLFLQHKKRDCSRKKKVHAEGGQLKEAEREKEKQNVFFTVDSSSYIPPDKAKQGKNKEEKVRNERAEVVEEEREEPVYFSVLCDDSSLTELYIESPSLLPLAMDQAQSQPPTSTARDQNIQSEATEANVTSATSASSASLQISLLAPEPKRRKQDSEEETQPDIAKDPPAEKEGKHKKLFCSYCHKGFNKNFDLAQHVRSHTGERPYQCVICGRGFAQKSNVKKHMTTHKVWPLGHKTLPSEEQDCSAAPAVRTLNTKESLSQNTQQVTLSVNTSYQCQYCRENFKKYSELKTHIKIHEAEKHYKCTVRNCGKLFLDLDVFLEHTSLHQDKEYRCHICSKLFRDLNQLNLHSYTHITDEQTREKQFFQCSKCKNKYSSLEALDHHLDTASHSFLCDLCDKEFASERLFRKHLSVTHSEGMFKCTVCKKKMKNEHYLKSHMMIHTGELPYQCKQCGAKFNRNDKLKRHSLIHSEVKKYKCPFKDHMGCTKEFHRFDKLKLHIMTHGNIKPFKCELCDNGFSRKEHLNAHIQKIHHGGGGGGGGVSKSQTVTEPAAKAKVKQSQKKVEDLDETSMTEYKLPDRVTDSSLGKSLETFSCETCEDGQPGKVTADMAGTPPQSAVGSAASQAMEILYSNDDNG